MLIIEGLIFTIFEDNIKEVISDGWNRMNIAHRDVELRVLQGLVCCTEKIGIYWGWSWHRGEGARGRYGMKG